MVASEAAATHPRHTRRQGGHPGGFELWGRCRAGAASTAPGHTAGSCHSPRSWARAALGTLKRSCGDGTVLVQHPHGHWCHSPPPAGTAPMVTASAGTAPTAIG